MSSVLNAPAASRPDPSTTRSFFELAQNPDLVDYSHLARQMLKRCDLIRHKHCRNDHVLRQGEGKLMHTAGTATKDSTSRAYSCTPERVHKDGLAMP